MAKIITFGLVFYCGLFSYFPLWCVFFGVNNLSQQDVKVDFSFCIQTDHCGQEELGTLSVKAGKFKKWTMDFNLEQYKGNQAFLSYVQIGDCKIEPAPNAKGRAWHLHIWEEAGTMKIELRKYLDCYNEEGRAPGVPIDRTYAKH